MFPNPCECTNTRLRHLQRRLGGVCCCASTLPENLKSKNKNESGIRVGAYCIRPINILSRIILRCTNTRLLRLRRCLWGVYNTPLPCYRNGIHKIRMYPGRGVLHTPLRTFPKETKRFANAQKWSFTASGGVCGRIQYAPTLLENLKSKNKNESGTRVGAYCIRPTNILSMIILRCTNMRLHYLRRCLWGVCNTPLPCYRNRTHKIRMYPGRGVLHTPPKRFRRKRRGVPMHKNDHSPPTAAFVGRMLLRLYRSWYTDLLTIRFFFFLVFFSCLDARKEPKEDQGGRDASQVWLSTY